ncbi:hypothetical protein ABZ079_29555 [Streptomyces sp. NPDC006314]|uniref:hypothetical protein n=1 Tax=Streptomyces sp. NPDC006314 TaxID=3154475 RepID=UPI0033BD964F
MFALTQEVGVQQPSQGQKQSQPSQPQSHPPQPPLGQQSQYWQQPLRFFRDQLVGTDAPDAIGQVVVGIDGVLVLAHPDKQGATATWKRTCGHHVGPAGAVVTNRQEVGPAAEGDPAEAD